MGGPSIFEVFLEFYPMFFSGLLKTLYFAAIAVFFGTIIGFMIAIMQLQGNKFLITIANIYKTLLRGTPILLQLYIAYYFVPMAFPSLNEVPKDIFILFALILNSSAYVAEIIRSGINAVDKGQKEAAISLGMSEFNCLFRIILPQAIKNILPALGNEYIMMIKETSLASVLAVSELMYTRTILANQLLFYQPLFIIAFIYLIVTVVLEQGVNKLEKRLNASE